MTCHDERKKLSLRRNSSVILRSLGESGLTVEFIYKALHNVRGKVKVSVTLAWRNDLEQAVRNGKEVGAKTFCYELNAKGEFGLSTLL